MKNALIYGALGLGALGGGAMLLNSPDKTLSPDTNYTEERSYEEYGDFDCDDFGTQAQAQAFFESEGYDDPHGLDRDGDGEVCETLE